MGCNIPSVKDEVREIVLKRILSLTEEQKRSKSLAIISRLKKLEEFSKAKVVMTYVSKSDEVDTTELIKDMLRSGKRVIVPVVDKEKKDLIPCEISSLEELGLGTFGVMEPKPNNANVVDLNEIDLVIVPGRAFDKKCNRLGRGMGYFDRFLKRRIRGKVIGLAFSEQVFEDIPVDENDVRVDAVVTEHAVIGQGRSWQMSLTSLRKELFTVRKLVLSSLFIAIFVVLSAVPTFPIIGVAGGRFTLSHILPAFYGILLGPLQGSIVIVLASIISYRINPPKFLFLDFLSPLTNTLIAGFLWKRKTWIAMLIYIIALAAFLTAPFTLLFIHLELSGFIVDLPFHWLHLLAIPISLIPTRFNKSKGSNRIWIRVFACSLLGTMGQHCVGSTLFEYVYGLVFGKNMEYFITTWYAVFWAYPIERMIFALASTIIGVSLIKALSKIPEFSQNPS
ncbi:MAG: 5-formyltetrahydrofolate cyclo-ligase [Thermoproteota archaeon]|nr:5-formyltetrahydrofolate cyclo-ligase [Candidatus Brockarchaeota archaeon]